MQESFFIKKIAVLGAGVMGAQIAAHCVNAQIETLLFDLESKKEDKNSLINQAIGNLEKLKPAPLGTKGLGRFLKPCNYAENLSELSSCDLVIEAIAERMDWKESIYQQVAPFLNSTCILVSNTSGLSINALSEVLPGHLRSRFCGVHFFNPPRYMHLVELIAAKNTDPLLLDKLETWLTTRLGKGIVRAKDTPNFIANRIGVFSLLTILNQAEQFNLGFDEVDALTGSLIGRPKSATFRTMDVVGLDTMQHVVQTMQNELKNDPWHSLFTLPTWFQNLIKEGHLGQKTGQGIYRKIGKNIEVFDTKTGEYRLAKGEVEDDLKAILRIPDPSQRMDSLMSASNSNQAQFLAAILRNLFHYSAYHLKEIADNVQEVDRAMRWGFGWEKGPFETWNEAGLLLVKRHIEEAIEDHRALTQAPLPNWLESISAFYTQEGAFSITRNTYEHLDKLPIYKRQLINETGPFSKLSQNTLYENKGVCVWHLKDDVAVVSFKSKSNTIGQAVLDGLQEALSLANQHCQGLIIYQPDSLNFSSGANLQEVASLIQKNDFNALERMIKQFQETVLSFKYSSIPIIAALRGRALGGGCELMMHCPKVIASFESYPGLVEVGVGLLPAGGGCKELALRAAEKLPEGDLFIFLQPYFQQIATARVAESALDAKQSGYLREKDDWMMNSDEVLDAAFEQVKFMQALNYQPPLNKTFRVAGLEGAARFEAFLVNLLEGGFISKHDYLIGTEIAKVICGGEVFANTLVDEKWMLTLERNAFLKLASTPLTQARIAHLLETGKPLRN